MALSACGDVDNSRHILDAPPAPEIDASLTPIGAALNGLRWEIPCGTHTGATGCVAVVPAPVTAMLSGSGTYQVELRFRGVVELKTYANGTTTGTFNTGGDENSDGYNLYKLSVSAPAQSYYLNAGEELQRAVALDFTAKIPIAGGATVTLTADPQDGAEVQNVDLDGNPIVVPDIAPAPAAYDGQFVQMDVVAITQ
ncbi:MAG: hypothetical protein QM831_27115 [Kofleriaceae bacterium]